MYSFPFISKLNTQMSLLSLYPLVVDDNQVIFVSLKTAIYKIYSWPAVHSNTLPYRG